MLRHRMADCSKWLLSNNDGDLHLQPKCWQYIRHRDQWVLELQCHRTPVRLLLYFEHLHGRQLQKGPDGNAMQQYASVSIMETTQSLLSKLWARLP
jgi:hypothetical protein